MKMFIIKISTCFILLTVKPLPYIFLYNEELFKANMKALVTCNSCVSLAKSFSHSMKQNYVLETDFHILTQEILYLFWNSGVSLPC
jgi:hypothetical protein